MSHLFSFSWFAFVFLLSLIQSIWRLVQSQIQMNCSWESASSYCFKVFVFSHSPFLSQVWVFWPWVATKIAKVSWRLSSRASVHEYSSYFTFMIHSIDSVVHQNTQACTHTSRVLTAWAVFWSTAAGSWELQIPHYVRCVYQMQVTCLHSHCIILSCQFEVYW